MLDTRDGQVLGAFAIVTSQVIVISQAIVSYHVMHRHH